MNPVEHLDHGYNRVTIVGYIITIGSILALALCQVELTSSKGQNLLITSILVAFFWGLYRAYVAKPKCKCCSLRTTKYKKTVTTESKAYRVFACESCGGITTTSTLKNYAG
jgi:hypothetical protein